MWRTMDNFEKMGIYDLRNYARLIGVQSPTTKNRAELIEKITDIINGKSPDEKKTNKGRPPLHTKKDDYILEMILPKDLFPENNDDARFKQFGFDTKKSIYQNVLCEKKDSRATDNILFKGYFDGCSDSYGICYFSGYLSNYSKENTIILKELWDKYKLKTGDFIVGVASIVSSKNIMLATDITSINGIDAKNNIERIKFEEVRPEYPHIPFNFYKKDEFIDFKIIDKLFPICKGSRTIINCDYSAKQNFIIEFLNI